MAPEGLKKKRQRAQRRGHMAEYLAALYLLAKGYLILSIRYKTPLGEIDIIAKRGPVIVFIEVKSRTDFGAAIDAVHHSSQRRIHAASDIWMSQHVAAQGYSSRYDIIAMRPFRLPRHVLNAF